MKAWDGRFDKKTDPLMERFSASIGSTGYSFRMIFGEHRVR